MDVVKFRHRWLMFCSGGFADGLGGVTNSIFNDSRKDNKNRSKKLTEFTEKTSHLTGSFLREGVQRLRVK